MKTNNFTGTNQSSIQIISYLLESKNNFFNVLYNTVNEYNIKSNFFCCGQNGELQDITEGYFGIENIYNSLDELYDSFNILNEGIWIHDGKYTKGILYKNINDVKETAYIDIKTGNLING